jgi:acyl-CoA hydrolase
VKKVNLEGLSAALSGLSENPRVLVSGNFATPFSLLGAFDREVATYRLHMLFAQPGVPDREGVHYESAFVGAGMRGHPRLEYVPARLSLLPRLLRDHYPPDVVLLHTSARYQGKVSLGIETNVLPAAIEVVKQRGGLVIAQTNSKMPYTFGDSEIDEALIDYSLEVEEDLATHASREPNDDEVRIGKLVAGEISDGSTLQTGIGAVPDSVLAELVEARGLRIWSEMFSDGVLRLHRAGALDENELIKASFIFGSRDLYDWLHMNPKVRMQRTEVSNNPSLIAEQPSMTSINAALQVDLFDQANASRVRGQIYSGIGGSTDFLIGALHAKGGQAFITLPSWHAKTDSSTIVSKLNEPVTHFQHGAIVTEQGIARMFGESQKNQALNLINYAANPRVRSSLLAEAKELRLI